MAFTKQYLSFRVSERQVKSFKIKEAKLLHELQQVRKEIIKWELTADVFKDYSRKYEKKRKL